jgi:Dolichyl-phosphate-mannose-protein mannosyltransferase
MPTDVSLEPRGSEHSRDTLHDRRWSRAPLSVALRLALCSLGFRLLSALLALFVNLSFPLHQREQFTVFADTSPFWDSFARFDTGYYEGIAWNGYTPVPGGRSNIAYFPVYPMLIRAVGSLFGRHHAIYYIAGIGISWVCFILAMVTLYHLARLDLPPRRAERAVLLTAIFPFAFFYGVAYSESTFLLFVVLAFFLFRTRRWLLGGLCGAVATATRVPGILVVPALAWLAWRNLEPTRHGRISAAAGLLLSASGFGAYCFYVYWLTGHPFEWAATLERWGNGYHPGGAPWTAPAALLRQLFTHPYRYLTTDPMASIDTLYGVTGMAFVLAVPFVWRRLGAAYGLFMLLNLWLPLSSGVFEGVGRYCSVLFPCFIWLATIRSRHVSTAVVVTFALFYTLGLSLFTTIHPLF